MSYSRAVWYDGIKFDSHKERDRYIELRLLERAGLIAALEVQPKFVLQEGFKCPWTGKKVQALTYSGDFAYIESDHKVVEDVKALVKKGRNRGRVLKTQAFEVRWKLARAQNKDVEFRIVAA